MTTMLRSMIVLAALLASASLAHAQTKEAGPWWPNKLWGATDAAGGSNWITPEKVTKAFALVKTGRVLELGHVYEHDMPMIGQRSFNLYIPSFPTHGPFTDRKIVFNDEFVTGEIGQDGTQFDGPGHVGQQVRMADGSSTYVFYNGATADDMRGPYGLRRNGVENVKPIITRAFHVDLANYKGVRTLPENTAITLADVKGALAKQGIAESDIEPGDALLFDLGWWRLWPDPKVTAGSPAYASREVVDWVIAKQPSMIGSDSNFDGPDAWVHSEITMKNGIWNLELMDFAALEHEKAAKFLFIFTPLRLKGATGSPGRPIAIL
ncbi:MAG TPA: cyclase family protein [Steroidobacteraceae bacterium]|nr:cyclase family protein [Steroidobacteraceae bacterium]